MTPWTIAHMIGGGDFGGAEQHVLTLLRNLDRQTFRPALICLQKGRLGELAAQENIPVRYLPMGNALNLTILPSLIRTLRELQADLLHNHGARANLTGRLSAAYLGLPNISTVHSSLAFDYLSPLAARTALLLDRLTLPLTAGIIAISQALSAEVARRGTKNVRLIYNAQPPTPGFTPDVFPAWRSAFRQEWRIPDDAVVIGSVARFHPTKGLDDLIEAAVILSRRLPTLHLLFVSCGPLQAVLEKQAQAAGLRYTITGFLEDIHPALAAMDLFVLPSRSEGMGLVLLEAMQAGLPIVATQVGGIPELIRHEKEGLLVPPRRPDAIAAACLRIFQNPQLAASLRAYGNERWPQFSVESMLQATEEYYRELLSKKRRQA